MALLMCKKPTCPTYWIIRLGHVWFRAREGQLVEKLLLERILKKQQLSAKGLDVFNIQLFKHARKFLNHLANLAKGLACCTFWQDMPGAMSMRCCMTASARLCTLQPFNAWTSNALQRAKIEVELLQGSKSGHQARQSPYA